MGDIVEVRVPTLEQEAARDLVRARDAARADLMRARHRVSKFLLRHGMVDRVVDRRELKSELALLLRHMGNLWEAHA